MACWVWEVGAALKKQCKNSPAHNLKPALHKIRFFKLRFFLVASFPKSGTQEKTGRARARACPPKPV
jgi:hypothetical protein